jgi:hypothetical protein
MIEGISNCLFVPMYLTTYFFRIWEEYVAVDAKEYDPSRTIHRDSKNPMTKDPPNKVGGKAFTLPVTGTR